MALRASCGVLLACVSAAAAHGQQVPSTAEPGRLEGRFEAPPVPKSQPRITVEAQQPGVAPANAERVHFTLHDVVIEGANAVPATSLAPLYQNHLGKEISLADVYGLRDAITAKYRSAGYILSQAIVPPQTIDGGVVHIRVIEGSIGTVTVEGDGGSANGLIREMAERIRQSRPLNVRVLERYTLLSDDLAGVSVTTLLKPSRTEGDADLVVQVKRKPIEGFFSADNRGSRAIGPLELSAGASLNSVFGANEQLSVLVAASPSNELKYIAGRYVQPLGPEGVRLDLNVSYSRSHPGGSLKALDALGTGTIASAALDVPLIRSRAKTLRLGLAFTYQNSGTDLLTLRFSNDRVRYLTGRLSYDVSDTIFGPDLPASNLILGQASQGLDILGARRPGSPDLSRANGRSDFTLVYGEATRVQRLGGPFSVAVAASGQYSFVPLLASQQFGLGGRRFGRGYEPSELTGDNGFAASVEERLDLSSCRSLGAQLYVYYEGGRVWQRRPLAGQAKSDRLSSAGVGVHLSLFDHVTASLELAKPLTHDIASRGNRHWRPLFDFTTRF